MILMLVKQRLYNGLFNDILCTKERKSEMEEIIKFKELLDKEIITQEEFDEKKKRLLNV